MTLNNPIKPKINKPSRISGEELLKLEDIRQRYNSLDKTTADDIQVELQGDVPKIVEKPPFMFKSK